MRTRTDNLDDQIGSSYFGTDYFVQMGTGLNRTETDSDQIGTDSVRIEIGFALLNNDSVQTDTNSEWIEIGSAPIEIGFAQMDIGSGQTKTD